MNPEHTAREQQDWIHELPEEASVEEGFVRKGSEAAFIETLEGVFQAQRVVVEFDSSRDALLDMRGNVFAIPVWVDRHGAAEDDEGTQSWVRASVRDGVIAYVLADTGRVVAERPCSSAEAFEVLQALDRSAKAVTAREAGAYAHDLAIPYAELWPKDKDIAVIGDPYQRIDRDRTTLVDYEYADELLPDFLTAVQELRSGTVTGDELYLRFLENYRDLHAGDEHAVELVHGPYVRPDGNPYRVFVTRCIDLMTAYVEEAAVVGEKHYDRLSSVLQELQRDYQDLRLGRWQKETYTPPASGSEEIDERNQKGLDLYYELKEDSVHLDTEQQAWKNYFGAWDQFLNRIPEQAIRDAEAEKEVAQARYWIEELQRAGADGPRRIAPRLQEAMYSLERTYQTLLDRVATHPSVQALAKEEWDALYEGLQAQEGGMKIEPWDEAKNEEERHVRGARVLSDSTIGDALSKGMMSDSPFGLGTPGIPINRRVSGYLQETVDLVARTETYVRNILPLLEQERARTVDMEIGLDPQTQTVYERGMERALIQEQIHKRRTQRSTPIRGFFPEGMKQGMDPQDQIVACYSLSAHAWESYNSVEEFERDLRSSLQYLKPGGKLIIGPIAYRAWRKFQESYEVDAEEAAVFYGTALKEACARLEDEGRITYTFVRANNNGTVERTQAFETGDTAGALIVERRPEA